MSVLRLLGRNARLYRNTGSAGSPVWSRLDLRTQLGYRMGKIEADAQCEDSNGEEEFQQVGNSRSIEVDMKVKAVLADDTNYIALDEASEANSAIEFAITTNGAITDVGCRYRRCTYQIAQWDEDYDVKGLTAVKFTLKKCPAATAPSTVTVSA